MRVPETDAIRTALNHYQSAFNDLDVAEARRVWPSVDERTLGRAFDQLERQQVLLEGCQYQVIGLQAIASCGGRASYVPKIGNKTARLEPRRWRFKLKKTQSEWVIESVESSVSR